MTPLPPSTPVGRQWSQFQLDFLETAQIYASSANASVLFSEAPRRAGRTTAAVAFALEYAARTSQRVLFVCASDQAADTLQHQYALQSGVLFKRAADLDAETDRCESLLIVDASSPSLDVAKCAERSPASKIIVMRVGVSQQFVRPRSDLLAALPAEISAC